MYMLQVETIAELQAADAAVLSLRAAASNPSSSQTDDANPLVIRIQKALTVRPLSLIERAVLEILFDFPVDQWLPYQDLLKAMEVRGIASNVHEEGQCSKVDFMAARALGLISSRMKECCLPEDYTGKSKPIEAFAARAKLNPGGTSYRLENSGRMALSRVLGR
jgi:hypothetical protein